MFLTRRSVVAAVTAAALAALFGGLTGVPVVWLIVAADGLLAVVVAVDVLSAPVPASLNPRREETGALTMGVRSSLALTVGNPTNRYLPVSVRDASPPSLQRAPRTHEAMIPPRAQVRFASDATPQRRGRIALGPIAVRATGPWGFAGRQGTIAVRETLRVFPALPGRAEVELRLRRARLLQSGERSSAVRGGGTEFDTLREYHPDDEFRRINWRATARSGKTISNVFREERNQQVMLVLDASRMMAANVGGVSRFEHAIDAAVAVAELSARVGDHVGMAAFSGDVIASVPPRGGRSQPGRILDALFDVHPLLEAPNYTQAFATLQERYRRRSLIVLITELTDVEVMEPLFRALPSLLRRSLVVVGSVLDPVVEELALAVPASSEDAYLKAAAGGSILARADAAARLRGMGASVVDRPPGRLAGALADHYLRLKAFGRL